MIRSVLSFVAAIALSALPAVASPEPASPSATASAVATATASLNASGSALVEALGDGASIDWTRFVMRVKGLGLSPDRGTFSQRKLLAKRMALADGYRRFADLLGGIRVNSEATVRDLLAVDDAARLAVNGLIRDARATDVSYWADGSAEVQMEVPLMGNDSLAKAVLGTTSVPSGPAKGKVTGVVIEARNLGVQPALAVRVRDAAGHVIAENLPFAYYHLPAGTKELVGDSALQLKARRAFGPTRADILLSDDESRKLKDALKDAKLPLAILL